MASTDEISVRARCHCSQFDYTFSLPTTAFPLKSALCHCKTCRHVSGHLFATFAVIPLPPLAPDLLHGLTKYDSSDQLSRYFCTTCGASICNVEQGEWELCTGILEVEGGLDGKLNRGLLWVGDSGDGGAAGWINGGKADGLACRKMEGRDSQDVTNPMLAAMEEQAESRLLGQPHKLYGKCHCEGTKFHLLKSDRDDRYGAGLCACTSCSKTSGFEITSWTFVPRDKVETPDGKSWESVVEKLGKYTSSPEVDRYFCKRCGSTIFYNNNELDRIDIAVGTLSALEGSRAQSLLHFNEDGADVAYAEDALDKDFVGKLAKGMKEKTKPGE